MEQDRLILVNEADEQIGSLSRRECHAGEGVLHRAFSVFLFNSRREVLLQRRSAKKTLWPLFWSNSCCSHPRCEETPLEAASRRLWEELGVHADPVFLYKFSYAARFGNIGSEREVCWVWAAESDAAIVVNEAEVAESRWVTPSAIDLELATRGSEFTPWLHLEWQQLRSQFPELLGM